MRAFGHRAFSRWPCFAGQSIPFILAGAETIAPAWTARRIPRIDDPRRFRKMEERFAVGVNADGRREQGGIMNR